MRLNCVMVLAAFQLFTRAQEESLNPAGKMPQEIEVQEQYLLLAARVKTLTEIQDLILKQQQLILEHLDHLRVEVEALKSGASNGVGRLDWQKCLNRIDGLQKQLQRLEESTQPSKARSDGAALKNGSHPESRADTNVLTGFHFEAYHVLPGDTLLKIMIRVNDLLEHKNVAKVTQEQIEKANPGIRRDKIHVGDTILIPLLDKP